MPQVRNYKKVGLFLPDTPYSLFSFLFFSLFSVGMKPELVLNEEQKNQRFRSSFNLRCDSVSSVSINTDYRRQEETSPDDLLEGTEENFSATDYTVQVYPT